MEKKWNLLWGSAIILLLVGGTAWFPIDEPPAPKAPTAPLTTVDTQDYIVQSSAAAADFDGDGDKEIVIGDVSGWLYVVTYDGASWSVAWSRQTALDLNAAGAPATCETTNKSDIRSSVVIADLDRDGDREIVVTTGGSPYDNRNGGVLVYTFNSAWSFSVVDGWPQPNLDDLGPGGSPNGCWDGIESSPAVGDLDGDGDLEIAVQALNRRIFAWHHDGTPVSGWPIYRYNGDNLLRGGLSTPAMGDIDDDGLPEVIVATNSPPWEGEDGPPPDYSKATVWAINGDSTNVPGWPVTTNNNVYSSPALGDIDGDGDLEIVAGSGLTREGGDGRWVYAWESNGSPVSGWPKSTGGDMSAPPALGDLDGDGDLEIVIGCGNEFDTSPSCTSLYAWHGNGTNVSGFPMSPGNFTQPYSPILADYDGNGEVDILIVDQASFVIGMVENNGVRDPSVSLKPAGFLYNPPLVDDVDNDGSLEVVAGSFDIYIWDTTTNANVARPWPMFHHDVYRTGNIDFNLDATPPQNPTVSSSTHTPNVWSNSNTVNVSLSGASDDESGISGYYYAWDTSPTASVDEGDTWAEEGSGPLSRSLGDGATWYFHVRAVNGARLLAEETVHFGPLMIDTVPPTSEASAPPCAVSSVTVSWQGTDTGSGIASYDVQVRTGDSGSWTGWQSGSTGTSAVYADDTGYIYYFRSQARDEAGNLESAPTEADAQTWLTQYGFTGSVYNNRAEPVFAAQITSESSTIFSATADVEGEYLFCHEDDLVEYALTASRSDFGTLPAIKRLSGSMTGVDFYLPPADDVVTNGQFETDDLSGWTETAGAGEIVMTETAHSGDYAVALTGDVTLTQSVDIPTSETPTFSVLFQYLSDGEQSVQQAALDEPLIILEGVTQTLAYTPTAYTMDWTHLGWDVSALAGDAATITFRSSAGDLLMVDEVSIGASTPGVQQIYLPMVLRQH